MDLFNPPPKFNYTKMTEEVTLTTLDNPYVQVVWEDYAENFTQEKIKSVRHYFQKKYETTNVNVITKTKVDKETTHNVDISFNILDKNYQQELAKQYLENKNLDDYLDKVLDIDSAVDNKMSLNDDEAQPFKRWFIKNIEFSNFLSYGENQKIDFDKCSGISVVESNPPNFGGKTVLTVDLLLFLFFNETTKTTKAEEIFNRFTDKNKVAVKGEVLIDGEEYIILRNIERKKSKSGDWNVKTELDFYKRLSDGSLQNFTGEQRRETEKFIKTSIGTKEDFLMTILTTATNLEDLIDSKPTARGQVLSRFMGLEFLKRKEEIGKEIYGEFSKSMISNVYSSEKLKSDNEEKQKSIDELKVEIETANTTLIDIQNRIIKGQEYRDDLLKQKHTDIDTEISSLIPTTVTTEIEALEKTKEGVIKQIEELNIVEPSEFYKEDKHDEVKEEYAKLNKELIQLETKIEEVEKLKTSVEGGIKCEHCGIELMNAAITNAKIAELDGFIGQKDTIWTTMQVLSSMEQTFVRLKKEFDEYEKNKLIKEKYELNIESCDLKINNLRDKIKKYNEIQDKIKDNERIDGLLVKSSLRMDELSTLKSATEKTISTGNYKIETLTQEINNNLDKIKKIEEESEKEKVYKIYLEIYGKNGITKMIMRTMMPLINSELQRLLEDSSHFRLEIRINDKNEVDFVMIDNNTQVEKNMVSGSGYERTIASLSLRAVLSKICSLPKPNIIVFDEVFGKISNENMDMVSEFFTKIKEYFEKIFVITHNPLVTNWADNVIKIRKEENVKSLYIC
jgi:DNA repair exonuclease SbcCD ATPase subunit